jgi:hypothetical protein
LRASLQKRRVLHAVNALPSARDGSSRRAVMRFYPRASDHHSARDDFAVSDERIVSESSGFFQPLDSWGAYDMHDQHCAFLVRAVLHPPVAPPGHLSFAR